MTERDVARLRACRDAMAAKNAMLFRLRGMLCTMRHPGCTYSTRELNMAIGDAEGAHHEGESIDFRDVKEAPDGEAT